jgi:hypothetical protein
MSNVTKINEAKAELTEEAGKENPDAAKMEKLKRRISSLGIGLTARDFN